MINAIRKFFHFSERKATFKNEIIGGIVTFVAMCYILPVNTQILSDAGMDAGGVFATTAILSCFVTLVMGLIANYPVVLSAGMGLNAFLAYTVCGSLGYSWQESMIVLTISGIIFFVLSLTPVRKLIIESIPKDLKFIISAGLGAFICFVGLKGANIIVANDATLVTLGSFSDPATLIALIGILLVFALMFVKNNMVSKMAIPIAVLFTAVVGVIISSIMFATGNAESVGNLPVGPWNAENVSWLPTGLDKVFLFGVFDKTSEFNFVDGLVSVLSKPQTYIICFSLMFVNLFDTTATLLAIGKDTGILDENGKMQNATKAVLADATGALICGPIGTSTVTSFAESSVGVSLGARTGLSAVVAGLLFLVSTFIFPVFSIFSYGCVTAPALVAVGALIFSSNFKEVNKENMMVMFTGFITIITIVLTYSLSDGIGIGLIVYLIMMLVSAQGKKVHPVIYVIGALFLVSFVLDEVIVLLTPPPAEEVPENAIILSNIELIKASLSYRL